MKYQFIQHLKTKSKVLALYDTLADCKKFISDQQLTFISLNYIGNFPVFNGNNKVYSIQGLVEGLNIVCSLPKGEAESFK